MSQLSQKSPPGLVTTMPPTHGKTRKLFSLGTSQPPKEGSCPGFGTSQSSQNKLSWFDHDDAVYTWKDKETAQFGYVTTASRRKLSRFGHVTTVNRRKPPCFKNVARGNRRTQEAVLVQECHTLQLSRGGGSFGLDTSPVAIAKRRQISWSGHVHLSPVCLLMRKSEPISNVGLSTCHPRASPPDQNTQKV